MIGNKIIIEKLNIMFLWTSTVWQLIKIHLQYLNPSF